MAFTAASDGISTPVYVKEDHSSRSYQSDVLEEARAVLHDLGSYIPMIPFQAFLDYLAPPQPDFNLNVTMQSLKSGPEPVISLSNQWLDFPKAPKDFKGSEDEVFSAMPIIFTKVVAAIVACSGGNLKEENRTIDFLHNPTSADRRSESRPDGYFVLKDRNKGTSKTGTRENILWADIALSCGYKRKDGNNELDDDVRKCLWSMQHVMCDDARHRASFGMTIENTTTRLWFCCRSTVIVSRAFNFIDEPENLVKLFAAFAFADKKSLGFDTTIQPVTGDRGQFDITVHPDNNKQNPRTFRTTRIISSCGAEPLRSRGTRVFEAVELDRNGNSNGPHVVLKDIWIDSNRTREGHILTSLYEAVEDEDKHLFEKHFLTTISHGDVLTELDILDDTANALMRGYVPDHDSLFRLQWKPIPQNYIPPSRMDGIREISRIQEPHSHIRYTHKTHYRIVFKEICITIDRMSSLPDVMVVLSETVSALRLLRKLGWVHRDVSIANIFSYHGHAKLADLEYAKKRSDLTSHEMRTGTMHFMSIEVAAQNFLFFPQPRFSSTELDDLLSEEESDDGTVETNVPFYHNHLHDLESLWWVAVWMVFYNHFLKKGTPSGYHTLTLQDTTKQLSIAQTLFPLALRSLTRQDGFKDFWLFKDICAGLPRNKKAICNRLNILQQHLIMHYYDVEAEYPQSVDPNSSEDDIYDKFTQLFSTLMTLADGLVLDFIPDIHEKLLTGENSKRPRSNSTNNIRVSKRTRTR